MRQLLILIVAVSALLSGCSRAPRVVEPVGPSELAMLVDEINTAAPGAESYRGTGDGEITVSGRTLKVAFAVVYERPGWLRADLRPAIGTMGASLTALALMEGECVRLFFPARLLVVTGCISDVAGYNDWLDPASLILGLPDASFILRMTGVTASRRGGTLTLEGLLEDSRVLLEIDEDTDRELLWKVYARTVIVKWQWTDPADKKDQKLRFNEKNVLRIFRELPKFFEGIQRVARQWSQYRATHEEDAKGN